MKDKILPIIIMILLIVTCVIGFYLGFSFGKEKGIMEKGAWIQQIKIDTIWTFKPTTPKGK